MKKLTSQNLGPMLAEHLPDTDFVLILNALIEFLRQGGKKRASVRFNLLLNSLEQDENLCRQFSQRFYGWLAQVHVYPALVKLGIFSRHSFTREMSIRIYERFSPSYKDFGNLREVFLYLFHSENDEKWLQQISLKQWLALSRLLRRHTDAALLQTASRQLVQARLRAMEMLAIWIASEALEPDLIRLAPKLLEADSAFVALQRETAKLTEHYCNDTAPYDTAHLEVMFDQCRTQIDYLRRRGTGAGSGSSVKVAHLLERLQQTLDRLKLLIDIQTHPENNRFKLTLLHSLTYAAVEQYSTRYLRRSSIRMLAKSITENKSQHGEHYITRNKREYLNMFFSAAGGGILIALMALHKIHIGTLGFGQFATSVLSGLNYGIGFMLIHMLHCTVATKQPAMTAARFAQAVERSSSGRAVNQKLAQLLIDVIRSQGVAVFGNVVVAVLLATFISYAFAHHFGSPLLDTATTAYQLKSLAVFSTPALLFAAIAGVWLFCSGIIAGFFDNRADYLNLKLRLREHPLLKRILPAAWRQRLADYIHHHYGAIMGNFCFGWLLGMTGYLGHLTGLPLDIRHVAFSSVNLGYAAVSGDIGFFSFAAYLLMVLLIGAVNLLVSFSITLWVALRSRDAVLDNPLQIIGSTVSLVKQKPKSLFFPPGDPPEAEKKPAAPGK